MASIIPAKIKWKNPYGYHFGLVIVITLFLIFIYQAWPWRDWQFTSGVWQQFTWLSPLYKLAIWEAGNHIVGILFFIPIIYAIIFLPWQVAMFISVMSFAGVIPVILDLQLTYDILATNIVFLLIPVLVVSVINIQLRWRQKERRNFSEREAERQLYIAKIIESRENERLRLAQELHDDTIQTLLVIAKRIQQLISDKQSETELKANAAVIKDIALQATEDVRRISLDLRPSILDDLGLVAAVRWLVDNLNKDSNINIRIQIIGSHRKLFPKAEVAVFRVIQEALNNIKRHSKATEAVVTLEFATDSLKIAIEDNGQGFCPPKGFQGFAAMGKLGLIDIQQRIEVLNGTLQIHSELGKGTLLSIKAIC